MPPTDASANAGSAPTTDIRTGTDIGSGTSPGPHDRRTDTGSGADADIEDTQDLRLPDELVELFAEDVGDGGERSPGAGTEVHDFISSSGDDLLDHVADWGPISTPAGVIHLVPVRIQRDLALVSRWMNDPAVAMFWELAGPQTATEDHLRSQLSGDGRSVPCLGMLEGTPMSYWEVYRADLDPLARHYPARPHDTGIHLLIGAVADRGQGLGSALLRSVADLVLDKRPACARVVAEPDLRNIPSVASFLSAGFRFSAEVDLPAKRAALMIRDRSLRHLL